MGNADSIVLESCHAAYGHQVVAGKNRGKVTPLCEQLLAQFVTAFIVKLPVLN